MNKTKEQLTNELIEIQQAQIKNYEGLSETNNRIIEKQKEYITKLEALLGESKQLLEEALQLLKQKQTSHGVSN